MRSGVNDPCSRKFLLCFDLAVLLFGLLLLPTRNYVSLGVFLCAVAVGLLMLAIKPRWFKFYVLAWLIVFFVTVVLVRKNYVELRRSQSTMPVPGEPATHHR